jgi:hypothetical protein
MTNEEGMRVMQIVGWYRKGQSGHNGVIKGSKGDDEDG